MFQAIWQNVARYSTRRTYTGCDTATFQMTDFWFGFCPSQNPVFDRNMLRYSWKLTWECSCCHQGSQQCSPIMVWCHTVCLHRVWPGVCLVLICSVVMWDKDRPHPTGPTAAKNNTCKSRLEPHTHTHTLTHRRIVMLLRWGSEGIIIM